MLNISNKWSFLHFLIVAGESLCVDVGGNRGNEKLHFENSRINLATSVEKGQSLSVWLAWATCLVSLPEGSFMFYGLFTKGRLRGSGRWSISTRGVQYGSGNLTGIDCKWDIQWVSLVWSKYVSGDRKETWLCTETLSQHSESQHLKLGTASLSLAVA